MFGTRRAPRNRLIIGTLRFASVEHSTCNASPPAVPVPKVEFALSFHAPHRLPMATSRATIDDLDDDFDADMMSQNQLRPGERDYHYVCDAPAFEAVAPRVEFLDERRARAAAQPERAARAYQARPTVHNVVQLPGQDAAADLRAAPSPPLNLRLDFDGSDWSQRVEPPPPARSPALQRPSCQTRSPPTCGDAACPRREAAVPQWPFTRKYHLTQHLDTRRFYCEGDKPGGCGDAACPHREAAVPQRPFMRKYRLTQHLDTRRFYCEGDKPGGCGDAACPRRAGAVPDWPYKLKGDLTRHLERTQPGPRG